MQSIGEWVFTFFALIFVLIAAHHAYEIWNPELRPEYTTLRHAVFVALNLLMAVFMRYRKWWFLLILLLITIQQVHGHGDNIMNSALDTTYTDWVIVILFPLLLICYLFDVLKSRRDVEIKKLR